MIKIDLRNFNAFTLVSILALLGGIIYYISWGIRFGVWFNIGIYSLTIVLVLTGIFGTVLTLYEKPEENN